MRTSPPRIGIGIGIGIEPNAPPHFDPDGDTDTDADACGNGKRPGFWSSLRDALKPEAWERVEESTYLYVFGFHPKYP
jgi:hypothetical protein